MEAREKAKELFDKFEFYIPYSDHYNNEEHIKECALIAVDEILNLNKDLWGKQHIKAMEYFEEVKTEINKL